eukprot:9153677-Prorocentrum_lima.AAC.1
MGQSSQASARLVFTCKRCACWRRRTSSTCSASTAARFGPEAIHSEANPSEEYIESWRQVQPILATRAEQLAAKCS